MKYLVTGEKESKQEQVLKQFVELLAPFSLSKKVYCYGYRAKATSGAELSQEFKSECFPLSSNPRKQSFRDFASVQKNYKKMLQVTIPNEDKDLTPTLLAFIKCLSKDVFFSSPKRYYCMIMLVEEDIDDTQRVTDFMVLLNKKLAATLILVGVGSSPYPNLSEFSLFSRKMTEYNDSKSKILDSNAIVFLSLQECKESPAILVKEILKNLPDRIYASKQR